MITVKTDLNKLGHGAFKLYEDEVEKGQMTVGIKDGRMAVFHTEVSPESQGKGYAKELLDVMVDYARAHHLGVIVLCPYVGHQFKKNPEQYADIWIRHL